MLVCTCKDVALQLLARGLFPSAPQFPTLAVDIQMLEFVRELFVHAAPNITAWCQTLETFLVARRFKLVSRVRLVYFILSGGWVFLLKHFQDSLRQRFSNTLHWFGILKDTKEGYVHNYLDEVRSHIGTGYAAEKQEGPHIIAGRYLFFCDCRWKSIEYIDEEGLKRPSDYLRSRCPLCFGGSSWFLQEDV